MSADATITIEVDDARDLIGLHTSAELSQIIAKGVARGMDQANLIVLGNIQAKRFRGIGPYAVSLNRLGAPSGRLLRSLRTTKAVVTNAETIGVQSTMGSRVDYFGRHEFGFKGPERVKAHSRRTRSGGTAKVKAFTRQANTPERKPLRTGLAERANQRIYRDKILTKTREVLEGR